MLNKRYYALIYLELKGQDRATYDKVRAKYQQEYEARNLKSPFGKVWSKILSHLRNNPDYNWTIPARNESEFQRQKRLQTPVATRQELLDAQTRLRNYKLYKSEKID